MEIRTTIPAGQNGTKQLVNEYGDQLMGTSKNPQVLKESRFAEAKSQPSFFGMIN